jgi:hypothetical protein
MGLDFFSRADKSKLWKMISHDLDFGCLERGSCSATVE